MNSDGQEGVWLCSGFPLNAPFSLHTLIRHKRPPPERSEGSRIRWERHKSQTSCRFSTATLSFLGKTETVSLRARLQPCRKSRPPLGFSP